MSTQNTDQGIVFDSIKIGLASPEKIHEWSRGEVKKPRGNIYDQGNMEVRSAVHNCFGVLCHAAV